MSVGLTFLTFLTSDSFPTNARSKNQDLTPKQIWRAYCVYFERGQKAMSKIWARIPEAKRNPEPTFGKRARSIVTFDPVADEELVAAGPDLNESGDIRGR